MSLGLIIELESVRKQFVMPPSSMQQTAEEQSRWKKNQERKGGRYKEVNLTFE